MRFVKNLINQYILDRPNLIKSLKNISWLFIENIIKIVVGLFVGIWIIRYLGPELFGLLSFAMSLVSLFSVIVVLGLDNIVVRNIVTNFKKSREILGTTAVLQFLSGLIAYPFILLIVTYLRPGDTLTFSIFAILGFTLVIKFSDISALWFESQTLSKYTILVKNIIFILFSAIKVVLIYQQASLISLALTMLSEAIVVALFQLIVLNKYGIPLLKLRMRLECVKVLMKDSWPLIFSSIAITIYMKIDQIMIGIMIGNEAAGIYSAATRISEAFYFIPIIIMNSVFPSILKSKDTNEIKYQIRIQKLLDLMMILSILLALLITFLSTHIVTLLFGKIYSGAGIVLAIHIWASIFVFMGVVSSKWMLVENYQKLILQRTVLGMGINIILNFFLIPVYGIIGAAIATVFSFSVAGFFSDLLQKKTRKMFLMKVSALNPFDLYKRYK